MTKVIITGGCGFAGHHFVEHFLKNSDWDIYIFDKLTYASSGFDRVRDISAYDNSRVSFFTLDITRPISSGVLSEVGDASYILHLAAETHVDHSITDPEPFVMSNVVGTMRILDFARNLKDLKGFAYFGTDEIFGPAPIGINYKEWDRYDSRNPYAATKAGGEELAIAYANTYNLPVFVTHCMNIFGERQHPEKFFPMCIRKILNGDLLTIHSDPTRTYAGSRFYIHARNVANAIHFLLSRFKARDKYNIVGEKEVSNLQLAKTIAEVLDKPLSYELVDFHSSRPGHDLRYALDGTKLKSMGWQIPLTFEDSLRKTVEWTLRNPKWLELENKK
jgi:dTDP-glucose 4,6-dehydratase